MGCVCCCRVRRAQQQGRVSTHVGKASLLTGGTPNPNLTTAFGIGTCMCFGTVTSFTKFFRIWRGVQPLLWQSIAEHLPPAQSLRCPFHVMLSTGFLQQGLAHTILPMLQEMYWLRPSICIRDPHWPCVHRCWRAIS